MMRNRAEKFDKLFQNGGETNTGNDKTICAMDIFDIAYTNEKVIIRSAEYNEILWVGVSMSLYSRTLDLICGCDNAMEQPLHSVTAWYYPEKDEAWFELYITTTIDRANYLYYSFEPKSKEYTTLNENRQKIGLKPIKDIDYIHELNFDGFLNKEKQYIKEDVDHIQYLYRNNYIKTDKTIEDTTETWVLVKHNICESANWTFGLISNNNHEKMYLFRVPSSDSNISEGDIVKCRTRKGLRYGTVMAVLRNIDPTSNAAIFIKRACGIPAQFIDDGPLQDIISCAHWDCTDIESNEE